MVSIPYPAFPTAAFYYRLSDDGIKFVSIPYPAFPTAADPSRPHHPRFLMQFQSPTRPFQLRQPVTVRGFQVDVKEFQSPTRCHFSRT